MHGFMDMKINISSTSKDLWDFTAVQQSNINLRDLKKKRNFASYKSSDSLQVLFKWGIEREQVPVHAWAGEGTAWPFTHMAAHFSRNIKERWLKRMKKISYLKSVRGYRRTFMTFIWRFMNSTHSLLLLTELHGHLLFYFFIIYVDLYVYT